jgi:hypothetical protein
MKRFQSRSTWYNTKLTLWGIPFLLLVGVIVFAATGRLFVLLLLAGFSALGLAVSIWRDAGDRATYSLEQGGLALEGRHGRVLIPMPEVLDVSLIDRPAARAYILAKLREEGITDFLGVRKGSRRFLRFTSVDVGLTTLTLGLGRRLIDRMPDARQDLVLLRTRSGESYFLSPEYNQELVSVLTRHSRNERG